MPVWAGLVMCKILQSSISRTSITTLVGHLQLVQYLVISRDCVQRAAECEARIVGHVLYD